jgi:2-oxoglutarate dehydrogenase E1 component
VIDDPSTPIPDQVKKVFLCTGKIYFEIADRKLAEKRDDIAVVRLEQLYPLPENQLLELQKKYAKATWFWIQEEPLNMGAASFLKMNLQRLRFGVIARQASASTATGYNKVHLQEQADLLDTAFGMA